MGRALIRLSALTILGALGSAASADSVDQDNSNTNPGNGFANLNPNNDLRQTFIPTQSNISGASIYLGSYWGDDTVSISIWNSDPYYGGSPVAGASGSQFGTHPGWVDVSWSPVGITPGNTYYMLVQGTGPGVANFSNGYNSYGNGTVYFQGTDYGQYGYDLAFKTWYAVPAPGSAAVLGLGGLVASRRRRA